MTFTFEQAGALDGARSALEMRAARYQAVAADTFTSSGADAAEMWYRNARSVVAQAATIKALADEAWRTLRGSW